MAIDPIIARGVTTFGEGLPQALNAFAQQQNQMGQQRFQNALATRQVDMQDREQKQQVDLAHAKRTFAATQWAEDLIRKGADPHAVIKASPDLMELAQQGNFNVDAASPQDIIDKLGLVKAGSASFLGQGPTQPTYEKVGDNLVAVSPDGVKPVFSAGVSANTKYTADTAATTAASGQKAAMDRTRFEVTSRAQQAALDRANARYLEGMKTGNAKVPSGYEQDPANPGRLRFIPGGPADPAGGKTSDTERAAGGYLQRMQNAEPLIGDFKPSLKDFSLFGRVMKGGATSAALANMGISPEGQKYYQAASDWVRAKLRKESGAVIGPQEMEQEIRTYFPLPGDTAEVIAQKSASRQTAQQAMIQMAGPASKGNAGGWSAKRVK